MNDSLAQIEAELNSAISLVPRNRDLRATIPALPLPAANSPIWTLGHDFVAQIYAAADGSDNAAIVWLQTNGVK